MGKILLINNQLIQSIKSAEDIVKNCQLFIFRSQLIVLTTDKGILPHQIILCMQSKIHIQDRVLIASPVGLLDRIEWHKKEVSRVLSSQQAHLFTRYSG